MWIVDGLGLDHMGINHWVVDELPVDQTKPRSRVALHLNNLLWLSFTCFIFVTLFVCVFVCFVLFVFGVFLN